ncbi:hypothetical protein HYPSUDRAFT_149617, partial [Hypholoma sublateritium FD-334 SS-4]
PSDIKTRRRLLSAEILPWRNRHLAVFPQLKPFTDALDPEVLPEDEVLFLPSDIPYDQHAALSLTHHASTEFQLREGEANNAVNLLCSSILHGMVLLDSKNEQSRGVYQNTRATKFINLTKAKKHTATARYRHSRTKLLALSNRSAFVLKDYPELHDADTWAKNAASARKLGDGAKVDSWIWTFGRLRGLNATEKLAFIAETEKVQWFRAQADTERWVEEVDLLEEEFRRVIRSCEKMESVWLDLTASASTKYRPISTTWQMPGPHPGYVSYAYQKADMYKKMGLDARQLFKEAGGEWPNATESLSDYVHRRRPTTHVNWAAGSEV